MVLGLNAPVYNSTIERQEENRIENNKNNNNEVFTNMLSFICCSVDTEYAKLKLGDLVMVATLGVGGFGRVELVSVISWLVLLLLLLLLLLLCPEVIPLCT